MRARTSSRLSACALAAVACALAVVACALAAAAPPPRALNITLFSVPPLVRAGQAEVQIACHYTGNFTTLQIFQGAVEIFRFEPGAWPAIRSFPAAGAAAVATDHCGSDSCRLQLSNVSGAAAGLYRCDVERDAPPYLYATRSAAMAVAAAPRRLPFVDGLAERYGAGEEMRAVCRAEPGALVEWLLNGRSVAALYGLRTFRHTSARSDFLGAPPAARLQCVQHRGLATLRSAVVLARWDPPASLPAPEPGDSTPRDAGCASAVSGCHLYKYLPSLVTIATLAFLPPYG